MLNKNSNTGADNASKLFVKVPKVKKAKKAVEEPMSPTAKEIAAKEYLKAVQASMATAQAEAKKAKIFKSANNTDSEFAAAVEASLTSHLQEGTRSEAHVDSPIERHVERPRQAGSAFVSDAESSSVTAGKTTPPPTTPQPATRTWVDVARETRPVVEAGSPSGPHAEPTVAKARINTPPPTTPQVAQPATRTWVDVLRETRPVVDPITAVRATGDDTPLQVSKPAVGSGLDVQAAAPTMWASVAKAGRPGVQDIAQAGRKPVMEVKQISVQGLLERIQSLEAELKDTAKGKEAVEQCVVKAEAATRAARMEMQTLKAELDVTKAQAADAETSHAADMEKWKGELDDASHDIARLVTEVDNQNISHKEETERLRATLKDKEALLEQWAADEIELRDRQQVLEGQLQRNQKINVALRALQQQQVDEALARAKQGVKRSHTHRVAIMSQLLRLRRSGAVSDPRMALLLEDFAIFQREHRLYTGEVHRLQTLREGGEAGNGDNGGGAGGGGAASGIGGGVGGGDDVSSGGGDAGGEDSGVSGAIPGSGAGDAGSAGVGAARGDGGSGADNRQSKRRRKRGGRGGARRASNGGDGGNGGHGGSSAGGASGGGTTGDGSGINPSPQRSARSQDAGLVSRVLGLVGRWVVRAWVR